jgi:hypothetical protein
MSAKAMHQVATLLRRWPRASAALGFGAAGTAFSALVWGPVIFHARVTLPFVLFIILPGVSAVVAGWTLGKPLFDPARVCRPRSAALRGALISSVALLLFAPLFATVYVWTQSATEHWSILGLTYFMLIGSALAVWGRVALIGAAVGWALYWLALHDTGRTSA